MNKKKISIVQINIRSIISNKDILEKFLEDNNIDFVILSETWTNNENNLNFKNYKVHIKSRSDGYGGVGFLINNRFSAKIVNLQLNLNKIEITEIEIWIKNIKLNLISFYNKNNSNVNEIETDFEQILNHYKNKNNVILGGDINAHHPLWEEDRRTDTLGRKIAEVITSSELVLLNDGSYTRRDERNFQTYTVDITLASKNLSEELDWQTKDESLGTDHLPIIIQWKEEIETEKIIKKINFKNTVKEINEFNPDHTFDIEDFEENIEEIILKNTKSYNIKKFYPAKPWWNEKVNRFWKIKKEKEKIHIQKKDLPSAIELRKAIAKLKIEIKRAKKENWTKLVESINPDSSSKEIWNKINAIHKRKKDKFNLLFEDISKAEEFVKANFPNENKEINLPYNPDNIHRFVDEFSVKEIKNILDKSKNTSPGIDNISYRLLKNLDDNQIIKLAQHFNKMWINFHYPDKWKTINVKGIKKQGKDERSVESYRPISLLSVTSKIFNKMIQTRLEEQLNNNKSLPYHQFGFKKGFCTQDYYVELLNEIKKGKNEKFKMMIISLDLSKAFDCVNNSLLIEDLKNEKIDKNIINWIYLFLVNRKIIFKTQNGNIIQTTNKGIPQGSSLSPILFNVYTKIIHSISNSNVKIFQFADDISILIKTKNNIELIEKAKVTIKNIQEILNKKNMNINLQKTQIMKLHSNNIQSLNLSINGIRLKENNKMKMLGITMSNKCSLITHYKEKKEECQKNLNLLKCFSYKNGGAHPGIMLNIYKSLIKSKISYAYEITDPNIKTINKVLQQIKNNGIRTCFGYTKTTPIPAILAESGERMTEYDILEKKTRYIAKQINNESKIGKEIMREENLDSFTQIIRRFEFLKQIAPKTQSKIFPKNLEINIKLNSKINKKTNTTDEIIAWKNKELENYQNFTRIYTDGSKQDKLCGIGIYFPQEDIEMGARLQNEVSIKTTEILAIKEAIDFGLVNNHKQILILTDSLSSCVSLDNSMKNKNWKFYENSIINKAIDNTSVEIVIMWIPAHIGIIGNEKADQIAKKMLITDQQVPIKNLIPIEDTKKIIKSEIFNLWKNDYNQLTLIKGKFNKEINKNELPVKRWFHNMNNVTNRDLKMMNRIRTNHSFNKEYKYIIKLENNPNCEVCNQIENNEHIIMNCIKYNNVRTKYPILYNNSKTLKEILSINNTDHIKSIIKFINECNINL